MADSIAMSKKIDSVEESTCFNIPLLNKGFAAGVIARTSKGVCLGYFFKLRNRKSLNLEGFAKLLPNKAEHVWLFGDLNLVTGKWNIVGKMPQWDRKKWSVPEFVRKDSLSNKVWAVEYDDNLKVISEKTITSQESLNLENDALLGAGAVEKVLDKLF